MKSCQYPKQHILLCIIRQIMLGFLRGYQLFISPLLPKSCRFYPTCSQYAKIVTLHQHPLLIPFQILCRILRCQSLCKGGIDYPLVRIKITPIFTSPRKIIVWFIPISKKIFFCEGWFLAIPSFRSI